MASESYRKKDSYLKEKSSYLFEHEKMVEEVKKVLGEDSPEVKQFVSGSNKLLEHSDAFHTKGKEVAGGLFDAGILEQGLQIATDDLARTREKISDIVKANGAGVVRDVKNEVLIQTKVEEALVSDMFNHSVLHALKSNLLEPKPPTGKNPTGIYRH